MIIRERTGTLLLVGAAALALIGGAVFRGGPGSGNEAVPWDHPQVERDLDVIKTDTLRVLVLRDPLSWERRPNAVTGLEYELLERFAKHEHLALRAVPVDHPDSMWMALQTGRGDVVAAQYAERHAQEGWATLTRPYQTVRPMLAQLRDDHLHAKGLPTSQTGSPVISTWSPFVDTFTGRKAGGAKVAIAPGTPEDQLMDVVIGTLPATVVTDGIAGYEAQRFPAIEFTAIEEPERQLAFAVRTNAPELQKHLDAWLVDKDEVTFRRALIDNYTGHLPKAGALRKRSMPANVDSISPYDADFRLYGGGFGWKWQLLVAMAWKESRFDSTAVSSMGAQGIMQLMPRTAAHLGVDSSLIVGDHINAAKRYITRLDTMWMRAVPDRDQRLRFVLASYNAGVGHIIDAQRLAERLGLDPKRWEHNVERAVLLLAKPRYYMRPEMKNGFCKGSQVFHYVRDIVALYGQLTGLPPSSALAPNTAPPPNTAVPEPPIAEAGTTDE